MKRIIAMLMAAVMMFGLCACSAGKEEFVPARGTVENNVYRNEAFGVSFAADSDWYFYTDEEIASVMGVTAEEMFSGEFADAIAEAEVVYDMYCGNLMTGETLNINFENLGAVYGTILDEKSYLEISTEQLESQMTDTGLTLVSKEITTVTVGGEELACVKLVAEYLGISVHETLAVKKIGDWMGIVTVAALDEAAVSDILGKVSFAE